MSGTSGSHLRGRERECEILERALEAVRTGQSQTLVLRGEAGIGKSALLEYLSDRAAEFRVARVAGSEAEVELPFAGLQHLCAPLLDSAQEMPSPQREAMETAFGLSPGRTPDPFLVGLAVLGLMSEASPDHPLLCIVDDAQWLDEASAQVLGFTARRLLAESVALIFAVREPSDDRNLLDLPQLFVGKLAEADARALLDSVILGPIDDAVRRRIVAEAHGNPLALIELPRGLHDASLVGRSDPDQRSLGDRIEDSFLNQIRSLPKETQSFLLVAAAEPVGDLDLVQRASERLGIHPAAAIPAEELGLIEIGPGLRFRHPIARAIGYRRAAPGERRRVHEALALETDADTDPDRRAWHSAIASVGPDEAVARELERSARRAQARGGVAAAASFLERAAVMTPDPGQRAQRSVSAAQAKLHAGSFESAVALLASAEAEPLDELTRARIDLLRAQIAFVQGRGNDALPLLLQAAHQLEDLDVVLARDAYLDAIAAAVFAGPLAQGPGLREVGEAARLVPSPQIPRSADQLLDALAVRFTDGHEAAAPLLRQVLDTFCDENLPDEEALRWLWLTLLIASVLWDDERWLALASRLLAIIRKTGSMSQLAPALDSRAHLHLLSGEFNMAASLYDEVGVVCEAIGAVPPGLGSLLLAAWHGDENGGFKLIETTINQASLLGQGGIVTVAHAFHALLCNGLGRYAEAVRPAQDAAMLPLEFAAPQWGLVELVEAATRCGELDLAADAFERLSVTTRASGTDWALGVEARARALVSEDDAAEESYLEGIERLSRTRVRTDLARTQLLYGEWLRREGRRVDARVQLRAAHDAFSEFGAAAFAERARRELVATGETARKRTVETTFELTAQEALIARLASEGYTNPEIGGQLFLSPRTVEYHLGKVFPKLGINSRRELRTALQYAH